MRPHRRGRGIDSSRQTTRPPGRTTRASSRNPRGEVGQVAQAERDRRGVERGVLDREIERVADHELELDEVAVLRRRLGDHPRREIDREDPPERPDLFGQRLGELARPARHVDHGVPRPDRACPDRRAAPAGVEAEGHQGVHPVVDGSDLIEHRGHGRPWHRVAGPTPPRRVRIGGHSVPTSTGSPSMEDPVAASTRVTPKWVPGAMPGESAHRSHPVGDPAGEEHPADDPPARPGLHPAAVFLAGRRDGQVVGADDQLALGRDEREQARRSRRPTARRGRPRGRPGRGPRRSTRPRDG